MTELKLSIPPAALQQMAAMATEITIIEDGLAQALTIVDRTRFQTSTELTSYLSRKLDKQFYTSISQRVGFQRAAFLSAVTSIKDTANSNFKDWTTIVTNFKRCVATIPTLQAEKFTNTTEHGLQEDLKSLKTTCQSLINREKETHSILTQQISTLQQEVLQAIKPTGSLQSDADATMDDFKHIEYQQRLRSQANEDKLASLRSALDSGSFRTIQRDTLFKQSESDVLEKINPILFQYMSEENNSSQEQFRKLHTVISRQLSTLHEWENKLNATMSILTSDYYTTVKKPLEKSIETMRTEIVAYQEQVVQNLRSIRDDLNNAYLEHKRGAEIIRNVKAEMDTIKQKWHQSIDLLKKKCMINELEELRQLYAKEIPEASRSKAFELCAEAHTTLESTEQAFKIWSELMDQRVRSEDAKMKEMEQVLNRLLSELVLTTHARSMGIDELNRRLSHKAFELTQLVSSRMDDVQFKQKLAGKVDKSDKNIAFSVYCPAEHEDEVIPQPPRGKNTNNLIVSPSAVKSAEKQLSDKDILEDGRLLEEYQKQCALKKEKFSFIKYFTTIITNEKPGTIDDNSLLDTEVTIHGDTHSSTAVDSDPIATNILKVSPSLIQQRVAANLALKEASQKSVSSPIPPSVPSALPISAKDKIILRPASESPLLREKTTDNISLKNIYITESASTSPTTTEKSMLMQKLKHTSKGSLRGRQSYNARVAQTLLNANNELNKLTYSIAEAERNLEDAENKRIINASLTGIRLRSRASSEGTSVRHQQIISVPASVHGRSRSGKAVMSGIEDPLFYKDDQILIHANNDINKDVLAYSTSETKDQYTSRKYPDGINPRTGLFEEVSPFEYQQSRSRHSTGAKSTSSLPTMPEDLIVVNHNLGRDQNRQRQQLNARRTVHSAVPVGEQYLLNESRPIISMDDGYVRPTNSRRDSNIDNIEAYKPTRSYSANAALKVKGTSGTNQLTTDDPYKLSAFLITGNSGNETLPKILGGIVGTPTRRPVLKHKGLPEKSWEEAALRRLSHAKSGEIPVMTTIDKAEKVLQAAEKVICQD